ncbi:MAG TPA: Rieske (2Fe-2S) protein [Anaerolineaceae bacterium]|nr:Rieske (2Fe-2S) protein [Anaerolineaceae bacterium]
MIELFPVGDVPENSRKVIKVGGYTVLIIHTQSQFFAVDNKCPHMRLPLQKGKISEDGEITCPFHRSVFDLASGNVKEWALWPPVVSKALGSLAREKALPVFETEVRDSMLWISSEPKA